MSSESTTDPRKRPLSPHLQVYNLPMTARMSILHRASGAALAIGTLMVAWWLIAVANGEGAYNYARDFASSPVGLFMIFGWSAALFYHMCNGVRHLFWDIGCLFKLKNAKISGWIVLLAAAFLTASAWYCAYSF